MTGTTLTTAAGPDDLGFFDNNPLVTANGKIAKLWLASGYPVDGTTSVAHRGRQRPLSLAVSKWRS